MVALNTLRRVAVTLCLVASSATPCPPYWQCIGKPEQNHPDCVRCYP